MNNRTFHCAISFAVATARLPDLLAYERAMLDRFARAVTDGEYWPGRGIEIEEDFPGLDEQKFWARIYLDTARSILDGQVGSQSNESWKARMIYFTYSIGLMFANAVCQHGKREWWPSTKDERE